MSSRSFSKGGGLVRSRRTTSPSGSETNQAKEPHASRETVFLKPGLSRSRKALTKAIWSGRYPALVAIVRSAAWRSAVIAPFVATTSTNTSSGSAGSRSTRSKSGRFRWTSMRSPSRVARASSRATTLVWLSLNQSPGAAPARWCGCTGLETVVGPGRPLDRYSKAYRRAQIVSMTSRLAPLTAAALKSESASGGGSGNASSSYAETATLPLRQRKA